MRRPVRHIIIIVLLSLSMMPVLFPAMLALQEAFIRHEMLEKMEDASLHRLTIPKKDVVWHEKGKELLVDGRLFDVKKATESETEILFEGLFDDEESALRLSVIRMHEEGGSGKGKVLLLHRLLVQMAAEDPFRPDISYCQEMIAFSSLHTHPAERLLCAHTRINFPPPDLS